MPKRPASTLNQIASFCAALATSRSSLSTVSIVSKIAVRAGTFLIVAPIIGPANQGTLVVTSTWAAIVLLIMAYGLQVRALREAAVSRADVRALVGADLRTMAILVAPSSIAAIAVGVFLLDPQDLAVFSLMFAATVGSVIGDYCSSIFRALDHYRRETAISLSTSILQMLLVVVVAIAFHALPFVALAIFASRTVFAAISLHQVFRLTSDFTDGAISPPHKTLKEGFPYFVDGSLSVLLNSIDILLLGQLVDRATMGHYSVGSRVVQLLLFFPWVATNVLVPALARATTKNEFVEQFARLSKLMLAIALLGATGLILGGALLVRWFLGLSYADLNALWPAFAVLVLVRFYESCYGIGMTALGRMTERVWVQLGAVLGIATSTLMLVEPFGIKGGIASISLAYCGVAAYYQHKMRDWMPTSQLRGWAAILTLVAASLVTMVY